MWFGRLPASTSITGGCCWPQAYAPLLESKVPSEPGREEDHLGLARGEHPEVSASALKHNSEKSSRLFLSMALLMVILPLAGCEKPKPKQPTVAAEPSFVEQANRISQQELDQLVASVLGLRRLQQQLERDCFSNLRSTHCRQLLDEGLGQMDASTANSIRAIRNARLQATLTL